VVKCLASKHEALSSTPSTTEKKEHVNWVWWHMPVISALKRLREEDGEFQANLG
jgi:hypothetical protein